MAYTYRNQELSSSPFRQGAIRVLQGRTKMGPRPFGAPFSCTGAFLLAAARP